MKQVFRPRDMRKNSLIYLSNEVPPLRHWQTFKPITGAKSRPLPLQSRYVTEIESINREVAA